MERYTNKEIMDHIEIFWRTSGKYYHLGQKVVTDLYGGEEIFKIVGIRENELELKGDWSGGTHNVEQTGWYPASKCRPLAPKLEWKIIKENGKEIKTS